MKQVDHRGCVAGARILGPRPRSLRPRRTHRELLGVGDHTPSASRASRIGPPCEHWSVPLNGRDGVDIVSVGGRRYLTVPDLPDRCQVYFGT